MILEHYSRFPLEWEKREWQQCPYNMDGNGKPQGFWVSVKGENDWPEWCRGEQFREDYLATCHRVTLSDTAKIRVIQSADELFAFDDQYGVSWQIGDSDFSLRRIDWECVAKDYDGIIIAPYIWSCRLGGWDSTHNRKNRSAQISDWYYGWDCASGCIWNANAIASVEVREDA